MKRAKLPELVAIAADQWGMVSSAQANLVGVNPRRLSAMAARGDLERLTHGVYRLPGTPASPVDDLRAAWIALDPKATAAARIAAGPTEVVSHRSAALVHGIGDLDADLLEFTTSVRRQTRRKDVRIHRGVLDEHDWTLSDGLPVTTVLRSIKDLADGHADRGHLASVVRDALVHHSLPIDRVEAVLALHARAYGAATDHPDRLLEVLLTEAGVPQVILDIATRIRNATINPGPEAVSSRDR